MDDREKQPSLHRPALFTAFVGGSFQCSTRVEHSCIHPHWSASPRLDHPRVANIRSSNPIGRFWLGAQRYLTLWKHLEDSSSSLVLRCGPSLILLSSPISLSDEAVDHAIRLPRLCTLSIEGPPPSCSALSPPFVFPPLTELELWEPSTHGWLSLFQRLEDHTFAMQDMTPLCEVKESLTCLNVHNLPAPVVVDVLLTSPIQMFRNLVSLYVAGGCCVDGEVRCIFKLDNGNVTKLAMALNSRSTSAPRTSSAISKHLR